MKKTTKFSNGKSRIGDGILYGFGALADLGEKMSQEELLLWLQDVVPKNESLPDMIFAIESHRCGNKTIVRDDDDAKFEIGFACKGCDERWYSPLPDVKACCVHHPELKESFRSYKSRDVLAVQMSSKNR